MEYNTLIHQFEIRFNNILNFSSIIREILNPYAQLTTRIRIANENTVKERIDLFFDVEGVQIITMWDRIIFKCESQLDSLMVNNSMIEEPFLSITSKLSKHPSFGKFTNYLHFTMVSKKTNADSLQEVISNMKEKYFMPSIGKFMPETTDFLVQLVDKTESEEWDIQIGPLVGLEDIIKRGFELSPATKLSNMSFPGELLIIKLFRVADKVTFSDYKKVSGEIINKIDAIWT